MDEPPKGCVPGQRNKSPTAGLLATASFPVPLLPATMPIPEPGTGHEAAGVFQSSRRCDYDTVRYARATRRPQAAGRIDHGIFRDRHASRQRSVSRADAGARMDRRSKRYHRGSNDRRRLCKAELRCRRFGKRNKPTSSLQWEHLRLRQRNSIPV